ncbi:MAG: hypothetical protein D6726_12790 [Nitrospirae bacterium]|nr:MAG: hypothetical protein D6726_12790 [Nitrospirota bacterium]
MTFHQDQTVMKKLLYTMFNLVAFLATDILTTEVMVKDRVGINPFTRACAMRDTHQILHNPIERILIVKTVVERKMGSAIYTTSYTLFGIKYAVVKTVCDGRTQVLWRRWFNYPQ